MSSSLLCLSMVLSWSYFKWVTSYDDPEKCFITNDERSSVMKEFSVRLEEVFLSVATLMDLISSVRKTNSNSITLPWTPEYCLRHCSHLVTVPSCPRDSSRGWQPANTIISTHGVFHLDILNIKLPLLGNEQELFCMSCYKNRLSKINHDEITWVRFMLLYLSVFFPFLEKV